MSGKLMGLWWPIFAFIVMGFEHSVANMFLVDIGLMEVVTSTVLIFSCRRAHTLRLLLQGAPESFGMFVAKNLIPCSLGNIVGAALFVACAQYFVYKEYVKEDLPLIAPKRGEERRMKPSKSGMFPSKSGIFPPSKSGMFPSSDSRMFTPSTTAGDEERDHEEYHPRFSHKIQDNKNASRPDVTIEMEDHEQQPTSAIVVHRPPHKASRVVMQDPQETNNNGTAASIVDTPLPQPPGRVNSNLNQV